MKRSIKKKHMIKRIKKGRRDNLSLSADSYHSFEKVRNRYPVILYTPDMENTNEHFHIKLNTKEARELRNWLNEFLKMKGVE